MNKITQATLFSSVKGNHRTPLDFYQQLHKEFNFTCDVAASHENALCTKYFTEDNSAFDHNVTWGNINWCNPPYGRGLISWIQEAKYRSKFGCATVMLLPARTDTKWFHEAVKSVNEIRFIKGRLKFQGEENSAPFPSLLLIWNNRNTIRNTISGVGKYSWFTCKVR